VTIRHQDVGLEKRTKDSDQSSRKTAKKDVKSAEYFMNDSVNAITSATPSLDSNDHVLLRQLRRVTSRAYNKNDQL
jgi:hypothetical protein